MSAVCTVRPDLSERKPNKEETNRNSDLFNIQYLSQTLVLFFQLLPQKTWQGSGNQHEALPLRFDPMEFPAS